MEYLVPLWNGLAATDNNCYDEIVAGFNIYRLHMQKRDIRNSVTRHYFVLIIIIMSLPPSPVISFSEYQWNSVVTSDWLVATVRGRVAGSAAVYGTGCYRHRAAGLDRSRRRQYHKFPWKRPKLFHLRWPASNTIISVAAWAACFFSSDAK